MRLTPPATALLGLLLLTACGGEPSAPVAEVAPAASTPVDTAAAAEDAPAELPPLPTGDFRVAAIELGAAVDEEGRVPRPTEVFAPTDTIHAAVIGVGTSPGLTLSARWLAADGSELARAGQSLAPEAPTVTRFSLSQPEPWPPGAYRVEIAINDRIVETRSFEVR